MIYLVEFFGKVREKTRRRCVYVCVCDRERQTGTQTDRQAHRQRQADRDIENLTSGLIVKQL